MSREGHMRLKRRGELTAIDVFNVALAVLLILWTFWPGGPTAIAAMWSAGLIGLGIVVTALTTVAGSRQDAANLVFGLLALAAPVVFGFTDVANPAGAHVFVGLSVAVLSLLQMAVRTFYDHSDRAEA